MTTTNKAVYTIKRNAPHDKGLNIDIHVRNRDTAKYLGAAQLVTTIFAVIISRHEAAYALVHARHDEYTTITRHPNVTQE